MRYEFQVSVEVTRESGPFASRADIEDELTEAIDGANPGTVEPGDNVYNVDVWNVETIETKEPSRPKTSPNADALLALRKLVQTLDAARQMANEKDPALPTQIARAQGLVDGVFLKLTEAGVLKP